MCVGLCCPCYASFCGRLKVISPVWDGRGLYTVQHKPLCVIVYRTTGHAIPDITDYHRKVLHVAKYKHLAYMNDLQYCMYRRVV